jgi:hypothetical protein
MPLADLCGKVCLKARASSEQYIISTVRWDIHAKNNDEKHGQKPQINANKQAPHNGVTRRDRTRDGRQIRGKDTDTQQVETNRKRYPSTYHSAPIAQLVFGPTISAERERERNQNTTEDEEPCTPRRDMTRFHKTMSSCCRRYSQPCQWVPQHRCGQCHVRALGDDLLACGCDGHARRQRDVSSRTATANL